MNKLVFTLIASLLVSVQAFSQDKEKRGGSKKFQIESFIAKRNAFIIAEVGLTPEEAEIFIPLYQEWKKKTYEVGSRCHRYSRGLHKKENPTDSDYEKVIDECLKSKSEVVKLEQDYYAKFKKILAPKKLYKFNEGEHKFMRNFMKDRERGGRGSR